MPAVRTCATQVQNAPMYRYPVTGHSSANVPGARARLDAAIALGGTVTGEHGVGILKRAGMRRELDPGSLAIQSAIRAALDPRGIFNPGKG
jgi:FAD/FMN-containing dehydrogenase